MSVESERPYRAEPQDELDGLTDEQELTRQRNLIGTVEAVFAHLNNPIVDPFLPPEETAQFNNNRLAQLHIVEQIRAHIKDGWSILDLGEYLDQHFEDADHQFLSERYRGLNVNGWSVFMAVIDPIGYGRKIERSSDVRVSISRRS